MHHGKDGGPGLLARPVSLREAVCHLAAVRVVADAEQVILEPGHKKTLRHLAMLPWQVNTLGEIHRHVQHTAVGLLGGQHARAIRRAERVGKMTMGRQRLLRRNVVLARC